MQMRRRQKRYERNKPGWVMEWIVGPVLMVGSLVAIGVFVVGVCKGWWEV